METQIALKNLSLSPLNVRKVKPDQKDDEQLRALIEAQGVLQNLVVIPSSEIEGRYDVVAGGRRLGALNHLLAEAKIDEDYPVPCKIKSRADAIEVSLAENHRSDMHPADRFVAYKDMIEAGHSVEDIAKRFGQTVLQVQKLLKLGGVAPVILDAFRNKEVSLDSVMAFTVSDDKEAQVEVWEDVKNSYYSSRDIKSRLLNTQMTTADKLFRFIGEDAYEKAGGVLSQDLFAETHYVNDQALVQTLAEEKMENLIEQYRAEGWSWVEGALDLPYGHPLRFAPTLKGEIVKTPELSEKLSAKNAEIQQAQEQAGENNDDRNIDDLYDELTELEEQYEADLEFSDAQKAQAGALLSVCPRTGELMVMKGIVKPEAQAESTGESPESQEKPEESNALRSDLEEYRLQALESVLMTKVEMCRNLMIFSIVSRVFSSNYWGSWPLALSVDPSNFTAKEIDETSAAAAIEKHRQSLDLSWLAETETVDQFKAFQKLSAAKKNALMAHASAITVRSATSPLMQYVASEIGFDLSQHWQPTKATYFNRVKKPKLLSILKDLKGEEFAMSKTDAKKGDLASMLADLDEVKGWLPESLTVGA